MDLFKEKLDQLFISELNKIVNNYENYLKKRIYLSIT